jgi:hypothetical protein
MLSSDDAPAAVPDRTTTATLEPKAWLPRVSRRGTLIGTTTVGALLVVAAVAYALVPGARGRDVSAPGPTPGASATNPDSTAGAAASGTTASGTTASGSSTVSAAPSSSGIPGGLPPVPLPPPAGNNTAASAPRPAAPSNVTADPTSPTTVRLQWIDNSHDEMGFVVLRQGGFRVDLGANTTTYEWAGLPPLGHICFVVGAYNAAGWSSDPFPPPLICDWICADTPDLPPVAPSGLTAKASGGRGIVLNWTDNSNNENLFEIMFADSQHQQIGLYTSYYGGPYVVDIDLTIEVGVEYCAQIRAVNSLYGASAWTPWACTVSLPAPAAPSDRRATAINESTIRLEWTDNSNIETSYTIMRKDSLSSRNLPPNSTSYDWTGLTPATEYCFRIYAKNAAGVGVQGPFICATTPSAPPAG